MTINKKYTLMKKDVIKLSLIDQFSRYFVLGYTKPDAILKQILQKEVDKLIEANCHTMGHILTIGFIIIIPNNIKRTSTFKYSISKNKQEFINILQGSFLTLSKEYDIGVETIDKIQIEWKITKIEGDNIEEVVDGFWNEQTITNRTKEEVINIFKEQHKPKKNKESIKNEELSMNDVALEKKENTNISNKIKTFTKNIEGFDDFKHLNINKLIELVLDDKQYIFNKFQVDSNRILMWNNKELYFIIINIISSHNVGGNNTDLIALEKKEELKFELTSNIDNFEALNKVIKNSITNYIGLEKWINFPNVIYNFKIVDENWTQYKFKNNSIEKERKSGSWQKLIYNTEGIIQQFIERPVGNFLYKLNKIKKLTFKLIVFDIETYTNKKGELIPYAIGWVIWSKKNWQYKTLYLWNYPNIDYFIKDFLDQLLVGKNKNSIIYAHNLIKFDSKFILKTISKYYELTPILSGSNWIGFNVKYNNMKVTFKDSLLLLPLSLEKLTKTLNVSALKTKFPHRLVNEELIEKLRKYKGNITIPYPTPEDFFEISEDEYKEFKKEYIEFDFKQQITRYLNNDLNGLMQCLVSFGWQIFEFERVNIFNSFTMSGLALKIFRTNYVENGILCNLPKSINDILRTGFKGGLVNVFKPKGEDIFSYDIVSLYPYIMLGSFPTGTPIVTFYNIPLTSVKDLYGIVFCKVTVPTNERYPFLATVKNNVLVQAQGTWWDFYTTTEIDYAITLGYKVEIHKSWHFSEKQPIFKKYVNKMFNEKANETNSPVIRNIFKSLLNRLYGIMGINQTTYNNIFLDKEDLEGFSKLQIETNIVNTQDLGNKMSITYKDKSDLTDIFTEFSHNTKTGSLPFCNIAVASFITGNARIYMDKIMRKLRRRGITIYYSDTDSLFINVKLDSTDSLVGNNIGQLKPVYGLIKKAYFINAKAYALLLDSGTEIIKFKGVGRGQVQFQDFENFYKNQKPFEVTATQLHSPDQFSHLTHKTFTHIYQETYNKGYKVLDKDGNWSDTYPFFLEDE